MSDWTSILLYIPGIIVFFVGTGYVRDWLRERRAQSNIDATVYSCKHVVRKDPRGNEVFNFYDVVVEFINPETGHTERRAVKSPSEYSVTQQVRLFREKGSMELRLGDKAEDPLFHPWVTMIGGAILIVLALENNKGNDIAVIGCLGAFALLTGLNLVLRYIAMKRLGLIPIESTIIAVYTRQLTKKSRFKGDSYTYYPIVKYELDNRENTRMCNVNSSDIKAFKEGEHITLYYEPARRLIRENRAGLISMAAGVLLTVLGILIAVSLPSAMSVMI